MDTRITRSRSEILSATPSDIARTPSQPPARRLTWRRVLAASGLLCACAVPCGYAAPAAPAAPTATVEGRVANATNGAYLADAQVSVAGESGYILTDDYGQYRVTIPAGAPAQIEVSYSGLATAQASVVAQPGEVVRRDFQLELAAAGINGAPIQLNALVVAAQKDANGQAIAIDEQRYAPNIMNVVSADQFGDVTEANVGEFLKNLPGVLVDYNAADARTISIDGLPPGATLVMVDGDPMASASSGNAARQFELEQVSLNNVARIEVIKSPTPDLPANAMGGAVNLVSKNAFDFTGPQFSYRTYVNFNSTELSFAKVPFGPDGSTQSMGKPGMDFTLIEPVSKNFGFVLTALTTNEYNPQTLSQVQWLPIAGSLDSGTPAGLGAASPYVGSYKLQNSPTTTYRDSLGLTADWRIIPDGILSFGFTDSYYNAYYYIEDYYYTLGAVASAGPTFTDAATGKSDVYTATGWRRKSGDTWEPHFDFRYVGQDWKASFGGFYSEASNRYRDIDDGFFETVAAGISGATVDFNDVTPDRPGSIGLVNSSGASVSPFDPTNWTFTATPGFTNASGYAGPFYSDQSDALDTQRGGHLDLTRDFDWPVPMTLKVGGWYSDEVRDIRVNNPVWKYAGPTTTITPYFDNTMSSVPAPYGFGTVPWLDAAKVYQLFLADPSDFSQVLTGNFGTIANDVNGSKYINESVSAGYLRADFHRLDQKLWIVTGVRFEATNDLGFGPLNDANAEYEHDANGNLILGSNGKPILITTDPVQQAMLRYKDRGDEVKRNYAGAYPSLDATYTIMPDLLFRASYARTITRPDFNYIIPGVTIADPTSSAQTITVDNTGLKPWTADNYDLSLEYYFHPAGVISIRGFRKDITNFFGTEVTTATPALLEQYGLDPTLYSGYDISTTDNVGSARVTGMEFDYSQQLTFLPDWAQGISLYGNFTMLHLQGPGTADFTAFVPKTANWGVSYDRPRYSVMLKWTYRSVERMALRTGSGVPSGDYEYLEGGLKLDVNAEYRIKPWLALFANGRNVTNEPYILDYYALSTPGYARQYSTQDFGVQWSFGLKGTF